MLVFFVGLVGAAAGQWLRFIPPALAQVQADQLWIYAQDGTYRLQVGTYMAGTEQGQPLIGLSDTSSHLRLLLRLADPKHSPVLVFKDIGGRDRLVIGLGYSGGDESPFITYTDATGASRSLIP